MTYYTQAKPPGTPTWIDLQSPDAAAARAFYTAVFGWQHDVGNADFGGYTTSRVGTHTVAGIIGDHPDSKTMPASWGLYFASNDAGADIERAVKLGAKVITPAMSVGPFGTMAVCSDPAGAVFAFWQAGMHLGATVMEEHGAATWFELYTAKAKEMSQFYATLLGATVEAMPGGMEYYTIKHGDKALCGIMQSDPAWGMPAQWVTYFSVANTDAAVAKIVAHGGKVMGSIDDSPFGRLAAVADPSGAIFKVIQPPAG